MPRGIKWTFKNYSREVSKHIQDVMARRLDLAAGFMQEQLTAEVSGNRKSKPEQAPGMNTGALAKSIKWGRPDRYSRNIGTKLKYGFWLEMGTHGPVVIRPRTRKALLIPVSASVAAREEAQDRGVIHTSEGYFLLRQWAMRGPLRPRPWLKPTFQRNLRNLSLTLAQKIE